VQSGPPPDAAAQSEPKADPKSDPKSDQKVDQKADAKAEPRSAQKAADGKDAPSDPARQADAKAPVREGEAARADAGKATKGERSDDGQRARAILEGKSAAADKSGRFLLQVAALGSEKAAAEMAARLKKDGLPAYTERVQVKDGSRWRVRVGPFASRADADRERVRLREAGFSANLVAPER
jgi:DedD protein